jgi:putative glutamine amidotransferase
MKIGLTYTGSEDKHGYYANWLRGGSTLEVVKLSHLEPDRLDECDGLVLSGGIDIHPAFYGSTQLRFPNADKFDKQRDEFEIRALHHAREKHVPVLGICRGLQLINCALGGTLVQDLGTRNEIHRGNPDKRHEVHVEEDTLLAETTGVLDGDVNSAHHQSIQLLGKDLVINCYSVDGMIEGVEGTAGSGFLLAVQWHPERMFTFKLQDSPFSKGIRDRFISEVESKKK